MIDSGPASRRFTTCDVDRNCFVEVNRNAELLFGWSREELGRMNAIDISPPLQPDGRTSLEAGHEWVQAALAGERPVFEWLHWNKAGREFICEVRLVRLPSPDANLCRGRLCAQPGRDRCLAIAHGNGRVPLDGDDRGIAGFVGDAFDHLTGVESAFDPLDE